jgi:predicted nucleotide-binding protein
MKPGVFIGSSAEQLDTADAIQQNLEHYCEPTVWNQGVFRLSSNALDDLLRTLEKTDFGIFVFVVVQLRNEIADHYESKHTLRLSASPLN